MFGILFEFACRLTLDVNCLIGSGVIKQDIEPVFLAPFLDHYRITDDPWWGFCCFLLIADLVFTNVLISSWLIQQMGKERTHKDNESFDQYNEL